MKNKLEKTLVVGALSFMLLFALGAVIQPAKAQFVIAEWDYPDQYGQGISGMKFWENSTGSWLPAPYYIDLGQFYYVNPYISDYTYNISAGVALKVRVDSLLNNTLVGADDLADGRNYHRHNVTVSNLGNIIFSQSNFTYEDSSDASAPMYYYEYYAILNFIAVSGQVYTVTVTYEVFY